LDELDDVIRDDARPRYSVSSHDIELKHFERGLQHKLEEVIGTFPCRGTIVADRADQKTRLHTHLPIELRANELRAYVVRSRYMSPS
jgi:hypothetical protein